ncbi:YkoP family protein [Paludifilum halophilum]|uniref:YkoP-like domain-containing protein n=1 Tax=Paludifilum halophilum TaxID=1642702 RepID=A0A235B609_9BACL|nr:hypothetical protein [Paludifilum halophilum]OYD07733.1 hypothetical protein CHM34_09680 [Paludifilum halophilum]
MAAGFLTAWRICDTLYYHVTRLQYVDHQNGNLFRVIVKTYRGEPLTTREGIRLKPGDLYAKLHLHNVQIAHLLRDFSPPEHWRMDFKGELAVLKSIRRSLPALASYLADHPRSGEIKMLLGTTFLHRGAEKLGFSTADLPGQWRIWLKTQLLKWILFHCHPCGWQRLQIKTNQLVPKRVFIPRVEFIQRYHTGASNE